ncbi:hypothetical protein HEL78_024300, partial [Escherichia coli]|nr:hypothetical protein [Escherichia coli]
LFTSFSGSLVSRIPGAVHIEDMEMFLSPLPVVLEWHCMMCEQFFHGKKFCEACGTGIYCRAVCTKSVYSYQPDLFQDCGGAST